MKIYFDEATGEYLEDMLNQECDMFKLGTKYFDHVLKVTDQDVKIQDTLGRFAVMSHEGALGLLEALKIAQEQIRAYIALEDSEDTELCVLKTLS